MDVTHYLQSRYLFWWYRVKLVTSPCRSPNFGFIVTLAQKRKPHKTSLNRKKSEINLQGPKSYALFTQTCSTDQRNIFTFCTNKKQNRVNTHYENISKGNRDGVTHGLLHCSQPWPPGPGPQLPFSVPSAFSFS